MQGWFNTDNVALHHYITLKEKKNDHLDEIYQTALIKLEIVQKEQKDSSYMLKNVRSWGA